MAAQNLSYLNIVNAVLSRMREGTVATVTENTYSTLIGVLVNQVKAEMESAYPWQAMRDTYTIATSNGTSVYSLTGAGRAAQITDVWDFTNKRQLARSNRMKMSENFFGSSTVASGNPTEYLPNGFDASYDLKLQLWPVPATGSLPSLRVNGYFPQDDLSSGSDIPLVPINVLIEGVYAKALAERGEDGGTQAQQADGTYRMMLADAVTQEAAHDGSETDWVPV